MPGWVSAALALRSPDVDVRIGVTDTPKDLDLEMEQTDPAELKAQIESALSSGSILWLTDRRGRQVGVPVSRVAYVEIGSPDAERRIGFGSP